MEGEAREFEVKTKATGDAASENKQPNGFLKARSIFCDTSLVAVSVRLDSKGQSKANLTFLSPEPFLIVK